MFCLTVCLTRSGLETEQCVPVLAASAVLFPSGLAGRQGLLVLAATVTQSSWHCLELPPVNFHPPTTPPLAQPIHDNPELMDCVTV